MTDINTSSGAEWDELKAYEDALTKFFDGALIPAQEGIVSEAFMHGWNAARAALATQPAAPADPLRVACVTLDGSTLTVPVAQIGDVLHGEDDQHTYTLTLKTMTRAEFEALGEFNGF